VEHLGDEKSGVLVVDESGFLKKGEKSVGVARQYTGTAGKKENCQVGVFLCYASKEDAAFVDRALYLPKEWTDDQPRLSEAAVPEGVRFATKGELAKAMLERAFEAGVPARWVVADTVYGMTRGLRGCLEERERSYVLAVTSSKSLYHEGTQRQVPTVAKSLPQDAWTRASAGKGSKGQRLYDWACVALPESGMYREGLLAGRWLLMRRSIVEPEKIDYYLCYGPAQTNVNELIRIAGRRWTIEDCFEAAKGEVGLDEYEVSRWDGWHRHITLCLLAHAYLAVVRSVAEDQQKGAKGGSRAASLPRADPAHRSGGKATDPRDDGSRRAKDVPARMVAVSSSPPGGGKALPRGSSQSKICRLPRWSWRT
jgi:SRSO17 transposase